MNKIKLILIPLLFLMLVSCKKNDGGTSGINPDIDYENDEQIVKTLYASLSENYSNSNLVTEYFLELTNKGNFYFTATDSEKLHDISIYDDSIYYKGTYTETDTKLLLNYTEYDILGINEFTKLDGLYILDEKGIAFSTRRSNLSESSYIGLYYAIIDDKICSIELKSNNEAIIKVDGISTYSTYTVNVSNIFIRNLNANLILNGTTLIYGDYLFERFVSTQTEIVGFITNLKSSIMMDESLELLGKYVDVCYSDYTTERYYITANMFEKYTLKNGKNTLTINIGDIKYNYDLNVIAPISVSSNYSYKGVEDAYFKFNYKDGLIIRYISQYNVSTTLYDELLNEIDSSTLKSDSYIINGNDNDVFYFKVEGNAIDINISLITKSNVMPYEKYEYCTDDFGILVKFNNVSQECAIYYLSEDDSYTKTSSYSFNDGVIKIEGHELVVYDSGNYISYEGHLLSKNNNRILYGYIENTKPSININHNDLVVKYLTDNGIVSEPLNKDNIVGYSKDYNGIYKLVYKINDYYIFFDFDKNYILNYEDIDYVSNINSNIYYLFEGNGLYNISLKETNYIDIDIYDMNFEIVDHLDSAENVELDGKFYIKVNNLDKSSVRLIIKKIAKNELNGIYYNNDSTNSISFDDFKFNAEDFTYDDSYIIVGENNYEYKSYGTVIVIDNVVYSKKIENISDGFYQLESQNEVMIIEIKNKELTYLYQVLSNDLETEYDAAIKINDYCIESKIGKLYYYKNDNNEGLLLEKNEGYVNLVLKELKNEIIDSYVSFNKTTFFMGDVLSSEDIDIKVLYSNGSIESLSIENANISYFSTKSVGNMIYKLEIGKKVYECNCRVLIKERIYLNKETKTNNALNNVYEFKPAASGDYLISFESSKYNPYTIYIYNDYSLKNLISKQESNSFYASEMINCNKNESYYILVELDNKADLSVKIKSDQSIVGTYTYKSNKIIFNSNKAFEYRDLVNNFRYLGTYSSNGKNKYILNVSKQYQIEGSIFNEVNITTSMFNIEFYGNSVILEDNVYQTTTLSFDYTGTYYSISDGVTKRIELGSNDSIGGGLLKYLENSIDEVQNSYSLKYTVDNNALSDSDNKIMGYLFVENGYTFLYYESSIYIKLSDVNGINSCKINVYNTTINRDSFYGIYGQIVILNNNSSIERVNIDESMIIDYNSILDSLGEKTIMIQYESLIFEVLINVIEEVE